MRRLAIVLALLASASGARADEDGPVRLSLATENDRQAWDQPGFRVQLGFGVGWMAGLGGAPSGRLLGPVIRCGFRLDPSWSLMGSFEYLAASADRGLSGLRYAGMLEPTLHVGHGVSVSLGLGIAGIVEGPTGRPDVEPLASTLNDSYTFPDARHPLPRCQGAGVAGRVRVDWLLLLGPRAATGLAVELDGQSTGCIQDTGRVEPDTAEPIERRQTWPHLALTAAWMISWR